jgi:hypothetical protein
MTGDKKLFSSLAPVKEKMYITFGDNGRGRVISEGVVHVSDKVMKRWLRTSLKRRRMKLEMMMERTMCLKLKVYPLLPLRPLWRVDHLLHGQRRCDKRTWREKLKLKGR